MNILYPSVQFLGIHSTQMCSYSINNIHGTINPYSLKLKINTHQHKTEKILYLCVVTKGKINLVLKITYVWEKEVKAMIDNKE